MLLHVLKLLAKDGFLRALVELATWDLKSSRLYTITANRNPREVYCVERQLYGCTHLHLHLDFIDEQMDVYIRKGSTEVPIIMTMQLCLE